MNVLEKILEEANKIKDGNRKEKLYAKYPAKNKRQEILNIYSQGYEGGTDNFYNAIVHFIRSRLNDQSGDATEMVGWIPCSERLPEINEIVMVTVHSSEWVSDFNTSFATEEEKKIHPERYDVFMGCLRGNKEWVFFDESMSETSCEKEFGNDRGYIYSVVIAWQPLPEPYKSKKDISAAGTEHIMSRFTKVE